MKRWTRAAAVVALVTGLMATTGGADAQTEGASTSNFVIDVVVVGTPPPGASITIEAPNSQFDQYPFPLADAAGPDDVIVVSGTIFRQVFVLPENDGGASAITYDCTMDGGPVVEPFSECHADDTVPHDAANVAHVDASFQGNANAYANTTITFTFGRCDGRAATVLLSEGDMPTSGADVILGTAGADTVNGLGGDDRICSGGGPDTIRGGNGTDRIFGSNGADRLEGGLHGDRLSGQNGNDTLLGQDGTDVLDGGANRDTCNGGPGVDQAPRCETKTAIP